MLVNDNLEYLKKMTTIFFTSLYKVGIILTTKEKIEVIQLTKNHYINHKNKYKLYVSSIDPFKFIAWSAEFVLKVKHIDNKIEKATVLKIAINEMNKFLNCEINNKISTKLLLMAVDNGNDDEKAIGKNGLYMAFRSANELCKNKV